MFSANVYRIMIGCPGDVREEVETAKEVINRWTRVHAEQDRIVLLPINWETNSYPEHGAHPQKILDKQVVEKSDLLIAIFGARLGSQTDTAASGTIEEIEEHIKAGKPVMLFFRMLNDTTSVSSEEFIRFESFKKSVKSRALYREYKAAQDFEKAFTDAMELFLADKWLNDNPQAETTNTESGETAKVKFSEEELERIKQWVDSDNNTAFSVSMKDGVYYCLGSHEYLVKSGRDEAKWKDFFERLEEAGFISFNRYNKQGSPVYELQMKAYDYFDK